MKMDCAYDVNVLPTNVDTSWAGILWGFCSDYFHRSNPQKRRFMEPSIKVSTSLKMIYMKAQHVCQHKFFTCVTQNLHVYTS